ncbi:MAG: sulfide/dihydroorotate dehydrogenase-like FAD/NAD-binding protein [Clostridia bacterium]|nr:sulfide/dihydroorotate dehydrogenase-like FAD/NAD-binding protein [Clostridia bacterium]MBQ2237622.1 sulfide/dihydroorotate dehydrogenase-like FAD/NAD-binding protein [Clostridia bacterium]
MYKIVEKKQLNHQVFLMTIEAPFIAKKVQPGQFIILRIDEFGERIPLTVEDFDCENGTITIVFQAVGFTTQKLASLEIGSFIADCVGPLGCPTEFGSPKKAIVIGGGVGCAIAYPQAKALFNMGVKTDIIAGFRNKDIVILEEEMRKVSHNCYITTDDGSFGEKGFVTDVLKRLIENDDYDLVIAIGPIPMMKFVAKTTEPYGIKTIVSLNPIMIDGTGMCGGCRVNVGGEIKFACVDGPDFDGHKVDFDELSRRNGFYREEEHSCRLGGKNNG